MYLKRKSGFIILLLGFVFLIVFSCKKDGNKQPNNNVSEYFIEGKVNNVMVRAEYVCPYQGCDVATANYSEFMNTITMQRTVSETDDRGWNIVIDNVTLDNWQIPDVFDASSNYDNENLNLSYYSGAWESDNNFLVDNAVLGDNSFQMNVTSKSGDVIEGTFQGNLRNGSNLDSVVTVTEGKFKIKLNRE